MALSLGFACSSGGVERLPGTFPAPAFENLKKSLIRDGADTAWVDSLYGPAGAAFLPEVAKVNIRYVEDTAVYVSFSEEPVFSIGQRYLARERRLLAAAQKRYGVPAEIITAILLIETKCGEHVSRAPVLDVLSTISVSDDPAAVRGGFDALRPEHPDLSLEDVRRRAEKRSRWAYRELRAFLRWQKGRSVSEIRGINGSWAGALGMPQFMPSSLLAYGVDADRDGRVDLFGDTDAIASVGHYLRKNGWKPGVPAKRQRRVILRYNRSSLYADAVLRVATRLTQPTGEP
ncbi:lytic murein transglycosylase [bacterium]|nr:lytic murein transglycosylase [bacterium]